MSTSAALKRLQRIQCIQILRHPLSSSPLYLSQSWHLKRTTSSAFFCSGANLNTAAGPKFKTQCSGCGAAFQQTEPEKPGFIPAKLLSPQPAHPSVHTRDTTKDIPTDHLSNELLEGLNPRQLKHLMQKQHTSNDAPIVCKYCHNLRHYNKTAPPTRPDTSKLLQKHLRNTPNNISVLVVDASDLPGSLVTARKDGDEIIQELKNSRAILVALNKVDMFSGARIMHNHIVGKIAKWVERRIRRDTSFLKGDATNVSVMDEWDVGDLSIEDQQDDSLQVIPVSAVTGDGLLDLVDAINRHRRVSPSCNVTLIGRPNAGKSQLINAITDLGNGPQSSTKSTTSMYPGSTVAVVTRPLSSFGILFDVESELNIADQQHQTTSSLDPSTPELESTRTASQVQGSLHDTPGLFPTSLTQLTSLLTPRELTQAILTKPFPRTPKALRMTPGKRSIFIGGLARIDYIPGAKEAARVRAKRSPAATKRPSERHSLPKAFAFVSSLMPVHVCRTFRVEGLWARAGEYSDILYPPVGKARVKALGGEMRLALKVDVGKSRWKQSGRFDVAIGGIGWVRLEELDEDSFVEVWTLGGGSLGGGVSVRDSFWIVD